MVRKTLHRWPEMCRFMREWFCLHDSAIYIFQLLTENIVHFLLFGCIWSLTHIAETPLVMFIFNLVWNYDIYIWWSSVMILILESNGPMINVMGEICVIKVIHITKITHSSLSYSHKVVSLAEQMWISIIQRLIPCSVDDYRGSFTYMGSGLCWFVIKLVHNQI